MIVITIATIISCSWLWWEVKNAPLVDDDGNIIDKHKNK